MKDVKKSKDKKEEKKVDEKEKQKETEEEEMTEEEPDHKPREQAETPTQTWYEKIFFTPGGDPNWQNWIVIALAVLGAGYMLTYQAPKKELVYMEFVNQYLTQNRVKQITITKDKRSDVFNY